MNTKTFDKRKIISEKIIGSVSQLVPTSKLLYHYTDIQALQGIVTSGELWATHASFLNDSQEIIHALNLINTIFRKLISENNNDNILKSFIENLKNYYSHHHHRDLFLISFSEKKDDLNQWRSYSNNGKGVCLVFDSEEFTEIKAYNSIQFAKIIYNEDDQQKCIEQIINESCSTHRSNDLDTADASLLCRSLLDFLVTIIKHKAYKEEQEVRLILPNSHLEGMMDPLIHFRHKNNLLIPYIPISNGKHPAKITALKKVIIGPTANSELTKRSIDMLFRIKNCNVETAFSEIPYREL
ncbi:DUF2971 domain-containing protein [Leptospira bandrabouensis]|uniref:DUF2971 domain-containing protein n=1 Tax=Leptospira bandrabouensis TaxID=2484903 RepID=UPI001EE86E42|nr:DUF2971 domain-containing protein [Leptospira bandrabouensis]MCG6146605.1 DUF2971 domain-containing protein [Leptospira bandrabouensis]MCG6161937.1 DUF2971 domain-containing protein [Leptospira bandrabouensis]MCG6166186.1 DUF2971 domain-containing protein [Leptospira bandrabouensis]